MPIRTLRAIRPVPGTDGHGPAHQAPDHAAMTQSTNSRSAEACCVHQSAFVAVSTATTAHGATIATTRRRVRARVSGDGMSRDSSARATTTPPPARTPRYSAENGPGRQYSAAYVAASVATAIT